MEGEAGREAEAVARGRPPRLPSLSTSPLMWKGEPFKRTAPPSDVHLRSPDRVTGGLEGLEGAGGGVILGAAGAGCVGCWALGVGCLACWAFGA